MIELCLATLILKQITVLAIWLAGDDVKEKKPDPSIYLTASKVIETLCSLLL